MRTVRFVERLEQLLGVQLCYCASSLRARGAGPWEKCCGPAICVREAKTMSDNKHDPKATGRRVLSGIDLRRRPF
jgi:hypothetical protein